MKYRKKPVVVDAIHYRGKQDDALLKSFVDGRCLYRDSDTYKWLIATPEGDHQITDGDYIIKGVKGEFYPCKSDIFEMTYETAESGCFLNGKGHIILTAEEAKLLFRVIDGFFDLRLPTTKEIVALNKLKVRVERIAKAEKCDER